MSTSTNNTNDHNVSDNFKITPFEPIITYDHMTDSTQNKYYYQLKNNSISISTLHLILEVSLMVSLAILTIMVGL